MLIEKLSEYLGSQRLFFLQGFYFFNFFSEAFFLYPSSTAGFPFKGTSILKTSFVQQEGNIRIKTYNKEVWFLRFFRFSFYGCITPVFVCLFVCFVLFCLCVVVVFFVVFF